MTQGWEQVRSIVERPRMNGDVMAETRSPMDAATTRRLVASSRTASFGAASMIDFGVGSSGLPSVLASNSPISTMLYTLSRSDRLNLFRYWAKTDSFVARAIDLHSELPLSRMSLGAPKGPNHRQNREINRIYEHMFDRLAMPELLLQISRELHVAGEAYIWLEWDETMLEWSDIYVIPTEFCFHPDTSVLLADGSLKALKDVQVGEDVWSHNGYRRKVLAKTINPCRGVLREIYADGMPGSLRVTPEHPCCVYRDSEIITDVENVYQMGGVAVERRGTGAFRLVKVPACSVRVGDQLVFQAPVEEFDHPDLTDELCALMGWYAAEGCIDAGTSDVVVFTLNSKETSEAKQIVDLLTRCFPPENYSRKVKTPVPDWHSKTFRANRKRLGWYAGPCPVCEAPNYLLTDKGRDLRTTRTAEHRCRCRNCGYLGNPLASKLANQPRVRISPHYGLVIRYTNRKAVNFFRRECPGKKQSKHLAERWLTLPRRKQRILLFTYYLGDGSKSNQRSFSSCSTTLFSQLRMLFARNGIWVRWRPMCGGRTVDLSTYLTDTEHSSKVRPKIHKGEIASRADFRILGWENPYWCADRFGKPRTPVDGLLTYEVTSAEDVAYTGEVHNLEVEEDHSLNVMGVSAFQCHSIMHPFNRRKELIFFARPLVDTTAIRRMTDREMYLVAEHDVEQLFEQIGEDIPDELKEAMQYGEAVRLNTDWQKGSYCAHIQRHPNANEPNGTSIIERCVETLFRLENLKNAQIQISSRNMQPKHLIWAEGIGPDQVTDLRAQVDLAMLEQADFPIVTNYPVTWQTIGANDRLLAVDGEYSTLLDSLAVGLATTRDLLTGQATYGGQRITVELMNTQYLQFREIIKRLVEERVFKPVAEAKGHYYREEIETWVRIEPDQIEVGDEIIQEHDGTLRRKMIQMNKIYTHSTIRFNRLSIRDNTEVYDQLFQLYQKGSLASRYLLDLHNIDPDENAVALLEDLGTVKDSSFNDLIRAMYAELSPIIVQQTDLSERVIQALNLEKRAVPLPPTGGGMGMGAPAMPPTLGGGAPPDLASLAAIPEPNELGGMDQLGPGGGMGGQGMEVAPDVSVDSTGIPVTAGALLPGRRLSSEVVDSIREAVIASARPLTAKRVKKIAMKHGVWDG